MSLLDILTGRFLGLDIAHSEYWLQDKESWFDPWWGQGRLSSPRRPDWLLGPNSHPVVTGDFLPRGTAAGALNCAPDFRPNVMSKLRKLQALYLHFRIHLHGVVCNHACSSGKLPPDYTPSCRHFSESARRYYETEHCHFIKSCRSENNNINAR
jgi:hypothetical protein